MSLKGLTGNGRTPLIVHGLMSHFFTRLAELSESAQPTACSSPCGRSLRRRSMPANLKKFPTASLSSRCRSSSWLPRRVIES